jgi:hypothetical protein
VFAPLSVSYFDKPISHWLKGYHYQNVEKKIRVFTAAFKINVPT